MTKTYIVTIIHIVEIYPVKEILSKSINFYSTCFHRFLEGVVHVVFNKVFPDV